MRRGNKPEAEDYIKVRLQFLHEEKKKNDNETAHLVLAKAIYELSIVLDLLTRNGDQESLVNPSALGAEDRKFESCIPDQIQRRAVDIGQWALSDSHDEKRDNIRKTKGPMVVTRD